MGKDGFWRDYKCMRYWTHPDRAIMRHGGLACVCGHGQLDRDDDENGSDVDRDSNARQRERQNDMRALALRVQTETQPHTEERLASHRVYARIPVEP